MDDKDFGLPFFFLHISLSLRTTRTTMVVYPHKDQLFVHSGHCLPETRSKVQVVVHGMVTCLVAFWKNPKPPLDHLNRLFTQVGYLRSSQNCPFQPRSQWQSPSIQRPCPLQPGTWHSPAGTSHSGPFQPSSQWHIPPP